MNGCNGVQVESTTAIAVPAAFALPAIETILKEFKQRVYAASLALNLEEMHVPLEALISVPVEVDVSPSLSRNEWLLLIRAESKSNLYPVFRGRLTLLDAAAAGAQIQLKGSYVVPLGALGHAVDMTLLRSAAESSLNRFVRELAHRVASLSTWTAFA